MAAARTLLSSIAPSMILDVDHPSAAAEARRVVASIGTSAGLSDTEAAEAAIIVNELVTNLIKHAKGGVLFAHGAAGRIDFLAIDRGPGMRDVTAAMRDGFSSAGTAGNGLGAVRRLGNHFDIHTTAGKGTAVYVRVGSDSDGDVRVAAFWRPLRSDDPCGDACATFRTADEIICVVADGLGHGVAAAEASRNAILAVADAPSFDPVRLMERMHAALKPTRGAAIAVAAINPERGTVRFAGVGNISATIHRAGETKSLVSLSGIVGHQVRSIQEFQYEWRSGATLIMHSDGLTSRWTLDHEPGLAMREPLVIAGVLARDFARDRDDRCVLVLREAKA